MLKKCQQSLVLPMKHVSVCTFKTTPFVPAQRAHMFQHVCAWCQYKRGRFERTRRRVEWTHGVSKRVTHDTPHHTNNTTQHNTTQHNTTQHNTTRTQHEHNTNTTRTQHHTTQRETETDRDRQRQRKKTGTQGEEKNKTREERRFIFSMVRLRTRLELPKQCQVRPIFDFFQHPLAGQQFFNICELFILCS